MSTTPNRGSEPAMPIVASTGDPRDGVYCANGLSIREHFAGLAMQGMLADPSRDQPTDQIAGLATKFADALIAELAK